MPFPAVQQDLVVDKGINTGIISIEQQTFKSVEEGLSFFYGDRLGVRRPPHPENEALECKVKWMWPSLFQGRNVPMSLETSSKQARHGVRLKSEVE